MITSNEVGGRQLTRIQQRSQWRKALVMILITLSVLAACLLFLYWYLQSTIEYVGSPGFKDAKVQSAAVDSTPDASLVAANELQAIVDDFAAPYGDRVAVVVTDLKTGAMATKNDAQSVVSASIYKLFVAYAIYKEVDEGKLALSKVVPTREGSKSIEACLDLMITISDNACGEALGMLIGWDAIDGLSVATGFTGTKLNNYKRGVMVTDNVTTARDTALLLEKLYRGTLLSKTSTEQFIQFLKDDEINTFLPTGLPEGTVIAHKIGYLYGYIHDAGIIYGANRDVVVVLLTGEWNSPRAEAPPVFAKLSSALWEWMN